MAYAKFEFERAFSTGKEGYDPEREAWLNQIEVAREEGHKAGVRAGHTQALSEIQAQTATLIGQLQTAVAGLLAERVNTEEKLRAEAITLAYLISSKLVPTLITTHPKGEIENLISDCLLAGHEEPKIIIQVSEKMYAPIGEQIEIMKANNGYSGEVSLVVNTSFGDQDCSVSWPNGGAKRDLTKLAAEIKSRIEAFLGIEVELPEALPEAEVEPQDLPEEAVRETAEETAEKLKEEPVQMDTTEADPADDIENIEEKTENIEDDSMHEDSLTIDQDTDLDADTTTDKNTDTDAPEGDPEEN